jgi:hypothetical protein
VRTVGSLIVLCMLVSSGLHGNEFAETPPTVRVVRVPHGGFQPQAASGRDGSIHLLYYSGSVQAGDLSYCRMDNGDFGFSSPIRVNTQPGSAIAAGTIRGGQFAIGKNGRIHAVWNGSANAAPTPPMGGVPLLYSRLTDGRFEAQRNLLQISGALDGGGSVAADSAGNVYAVWHGAGSSSRNEGDRKLWMARSTDGGVGFSPEVAINPSPTGACACCSVKALATNDGTLFALYRSAEKRVNRDMNLISSTDRGVRFRGRSIHPWKVPT